MVVSNTNRCEVNKKTPTGQLDLHLHLSCSEFNSIELVED